MIKDTQCEGKVLAGVGCLQHSAASHRDICYDVFFLSLTMVADTLLASS
jgi:hypothetical protein